MIEVEVEDETWLAALPDAEVVALAAAEAALESGGGLQPPSPPAGVLPPLRRGRRDDIGFVQDTAPLPPLRSGGGGAAWIHAVTEGADAHSASLTLLLTDDATVQDLNARFRGADRPTNVLAFPAAPSAAPHLGDVALAFGVCAREAGEQGKTLAHHLAHLTAHGVLHLLGWDHEDGAQAEAMEGRERAILARLGVPDPYAHEHG